MSWKIEWGSLLSSIAAYLSTPSQDSVDNILERDVIGNKTDTASTSKNDTDSLISYSKGILDLLGVPTTITGTFTTSSDSAPADSVFGSTYNANYFWNSDIIPLSGACAYQRRKIISMSAAGVYILDRAFTTATGYVSYLIIPGVEAHAPLLKTYSININGAAGTTVMFTCTTDAVEIESLSIRVSDTTCVGTNITSISIQTDDTTPHVFISAADGVVANLTAQATLSWANYGGIYYMPVGKTIGLTIATTGTGTARTSIVTVKYRQIGVGGYLA